MFGISSATHRMSQANGRPALHAFGRHVGSGSSFMDGFEAVVPEWMSRGKCGEPGVRDEVDFFPEGKRNKVAAEAPAVAVCRTQCPVMAECRAWVLHRDLTERSLVPGVLGGMHEADRKVIRKAALSARTGVVAPGDHVDSVISA